MVQLAMVGPAKWQKTAAPSHDVQAVIMQFRIVGLLYQQWIAPP